jgi:acyl-CoA synthetase (AMP-forming)/AMP-acid ligase II
MPKTIAITPSWYWPTGTARVAGVPPFSLTELCIDRTARDHPDSSALVSDSARMTFAELYADVHRTAWALQDLGARRAALVADPGPDTVVLLLAALAAGLHLRLVAPGERPADEDGLLILDASMRASAPPGDRPLIVPTAASLREGTVTLPGRYGGVMHSQRTLLASVISFVTFLEAEPGRPWMPLVPLSRWEGLVASLAPLYLGGPAVLPPPSADAESTVQTITREQVGYAFADLTDAAQLSRDAKKAAKDARHILAAFLLSVDGMFDPDERRRVGRAFECPALTVWGTAETGPVFSSHASWYLDESVGIPITNAQVVPADPRTGEPIAALWELVDQAEVTVWSPAVCAGYVEDGHEERWANGRFRTGMMASSDANGMVYLLGGS